MGRILLWVLGGIFFALGIIGAFLPVMPTVPFIIAASACWAKASPRLHAYLRNHPQFGAQLRNWEDHGTIPRKAKWLASIAMTCSCSGTLAFFWLTGKPIWIPLLVTGICFSVGVWIWLRPEPCKHT